MPRRKIRLERPSHVRFSEPHADRAVGFINSCCRHTKGRWAGAPFQMRPWQERDIREIFGRVDEEGNRVIRTVYEEIPKKNGKSEKAAAIANKLLFADDEPGAEIYGAAADRDQASIVFNVAAAMVRLSPALSSRCRIVDSTKRIVLRDEPSFYRALSAEVSGKHGYNSHGVIFDEVHAQRNHDLWNVLTFGAGAARTQPLVYAITTAGVPGESPVAEMLHQEADQILRGITPCPDEFYPVIYAAEDDDPWDDEEVWHLCNPALGDFLSLETLRQECAQAKRRPSDYNNFLQLHLNRWVQQLERWIPMEQWDAGGTFTDVQSYMQWRDAELRELKDTPCYAGLDLSTKMDVTALVLVWLDRSNTFHWIPYFWIPKDNLVDRPNIEVAKYRTWIGQGLLNVTEGNAIDFEAVRRRINELHRIVHFRQIAYDPKFAHQLAQQLEGDGITMVEIHQGFNSFNEPCHELEAALADGRVRHGGNPVLRWMADCTAIKRRSWDQAIRPAKPDREKSGKRIDGIVAGLMGMSRAILEPQPRLSIYERAETAII